MTGCAARISDSQGLPAYSKRITLTAAPRRCGISGGDPPADEQPLLCLAFAGFVRASSPYRAWHGIVGYARRLRLLSGAARILARVVAFIETSAVLLLLASAAIILVPLLLLLFVITFITALLSAKLLHRLAGAIRDRMSMSSSRPKRTAIAGVILLWGNGGAVAQKLRFCHRRIPRSEKQCRILVS